MNVIEIWQPRYKDNTVLIATYKVKSGYNYIKFTKAKHLEGKLYRLHSTDIDNRKVQRNGNGNVYIVPFEKLELVEDEPKQEIVKTYKYKISAKGKTVVYDNYEEFYKVFSNLMAREKNGEDFDYKIEIGRDVE